MGKGQEQKTQPESQVEIQERGDIYFLYRPKVGREEAHSADDVQRLYIILRPESGEKPVEEKQDPHSGKEANINNNKKGSGSASEGGHGSQEVNIEEKSLFRLIVMGRKRLPDATDKRRPYWGFVEMVTTDAHNIKTALKGEEYETSTRGHRHISEARAVGEGIYCILRHKQAIKHKRGYTHTHLVYKLEIPKEQDEGEPQESLNIEPQGSFIIQIKNPQHKPQEDTHTSTSNFKGGLKNKRKAVFPAHLQAHLGHLKFAPLDPPDLLNYEGCEILLIFASDNVKKELGLDLEEEAQHDDDDYDDDDDDDASSCSVSSDLLDTFGDTVSATPLLKGTWI